MFSKELLLDAGDFDVLGWSSRKRAETENDSDFFVYEMRAWRFKKLTEFWVFLTCWISIIGEIAILGGGGESTSSSDDDEFDLDRLWLLDLERDFVLVTLKFDGESHVINDFAW